MDRSDQLKNTLEILNAIQHKSISDKMKIVDYHNVITILYESIIDLYEEVYKELLSITEKENGGRN